MTGKYSIGLDFGTNSVRTLIVDVGNGEEIATFVWGYATGDEGILIDANDPNLARQYPMDYSDGVVNSVKGALDIASEIPGFSAGNIIGIGVDTTGSTPLPVDEKGEPLAFKKEFEDNLSAMAWLWKDHTSYAEAGEITEKARQIRPEYLAKCGGTYSSEWFWAKALHCLRVDPEVFNAAYTWVECADWIPALLTGSTNPKTLKRGICAAGHKAMFNPAWGGYPDEEFLVEVDKGLARLRATLPDKAYSIADVAGTLTDEWSEKLGLPAGIPVAIGAFDAHLGAVASGIGPGVMVKILGTSSCDMMVVPFGRELADVPGLCGIVPESILPEHFGLEAGQAAFGDLYNWFVNHIQAGGVEKGSHEALTQQAEGIKPGASGLLALDWHNGNRTVLVDQRLTGVLLGMTLHTTPGEIYRALIEATAFGARIIMERFEEYGVKVERVVNCGGISVKNPLVMQILADVTGRNMEVSQSEQTCALGAAIAGAVVAGEPSGGYDNYTDAASAMTGVREKKYSPIAENAKVYDGLFTLYRKLHDIFGTKEYTDNLYNVMKELLKIRDEAKEK